MGAHPKRYGLVQPQDAFLLCAGRGGQDGGAGSLPGTELHHRQGPLLREAADLCVLRHADHAQDRTEEKAGEAGLEEGQDLRGVDHEEDQIQGEGEDLRPDQGQEGGRQAGGDGDPLQRGVQDGVPVLRPGHNGGPDAGVLQRHQHDQVSTIDFRKPGPPCVRHPCPAAAEAEAQGPGQLQKRHDVHPAGHRRGGKGAGHPGGPLRRAVPAA
mmetsp:Transcript_3592/g.12605  ORF Transcript_3592/g.12605 Transcript_3592/m.12605 type:complete len:212 (+) Transcript_3592:558-1193(+)